MEILINAHGAGFAQGSTSCPVTGGPQAHSCRGGVHGHLEGPLGAPVLALPCLWLPSLEGPWPSPCPSRRTGGQAVLGPVEQDGPGWLGSGS